MNDLSPVPALARMSVARLIEWGRNAIARAGSFEEVRELRDRFEALRVYQRAQGAALDALNAATQLRARCDMRMGEALAGREKARGRLYRGDTLSLRDEAATLAELHLNGKQSERLQELARVPEMIFEAILDAHTAQQAPVTTAGILRAAARAEALGQTPDDIRAAPFPEPAAAARFWSALDRAAARELPIEKSTGEYEWNTPPEIIAAARRVLGEIDLDPASNPTAQRIVGARQFYSRDDDGLARRWCGRVWMNPPYAHDLIVRFIDKLCRHLSSGEISAAIVLVDNRTDTQWFHAAARLAERVCFTAGRVRFLRPDGSDPGGPLNGSCLFYFGGEGDRFASVFGKFGLVYPRCL